MAGQETVLNGTEIVRGLRRKRVSAWLREFHPRLRPAFAKRKRRKIKPLKAVWAAQGIEAELNGTAFYVVPFNWSG
jgi:hypothetical protein